MRRMRRLDRWGGMVSILGGLWAASFGSAAELLRVEEVELQPLLAATGRLVQSQDYVPQTLNQPLRQ